MSKLTDYPFEVRPLSSEEGGGYLISFPDFAECLSDGDSVDDPNHDQIPAGASLTVTLVAAEPMGAGTAFVGVPAQTLDSTLLAADPSVFQLYYTRAESVVSIPIPPG